MQSVHIDSFFVGPSNFHSSPSFSYHGLWHTQRLFDSHVLVFFYTETAYSVLTITQSSGGVCGRWRGAMRDERVSRFVFGLIISLCFLSNVHVGGGVSLPRVRSVAMRILFCVYLALRDNEIKVGGRVCVISPSLAARLHV